MNRRSFMQRAEVSGAGALLGTAQFGAQAQAQTRRQSGAGDAPKEIRNILLLFADQHRQDCVGAYGNKVVQTPNLDRLARTGIRFNNAYTPAPVCTPARACVQTGQWAHNHGLIYNTGNAPSRARQNETNPNSKYFSAILREKGWQLSHIGKFHVGLQKPSAYGYDEEAFYPGYGYPSNHPHYIAYLKSQGVDGFRLTEEILDPTGFRHYAGLQEGPQSASIPAYLASQTIATIKRHTAQDRPFFISCNFWGPHAPFNITRKHYEMYDKTRIEPWPNCFCDLSDKPGVITRYGEYWKSGWFSRETLPRLIGKGYGYISLIDEEIGHILKALEDAGELERTLIFYTVDHGSSDGSYLYWDKGFGMYDCITRIPFIVSHPSIRPAVSEDFISLVDLAPTFLEVGGCPIPEVMDGISLMPALRGESLPGRGEHIVTESFGHQQPFPQRMVRTKTTKYIFNPVDRDEFYDLSADPWETRNIIGKVDKTVLSRHREILTEWIKETRDPLGTWATPVLS
ncbi:MAG: sulfatase-like hydrolase/transferase [Candidatus Latescibacterota bacterium]